MSSCGLEPPASVLPLTGADRQIPSVISYIGGDEFHGTQAKSQLVRNSKNTVAYFRDFLGKEYVLALLGARRLAELKLASRR